MSGNPMKCLLVLLCAFFSATLTSAQTVATSCWAMGMNTIKPAWPGHYNGRINKAAKLSDGYVVCGSASRGIFPSKDNNIIGRTSWSGPYIAKYDFSGNLQWLDHGVDSAYAALPEWSNIISIATDSNDNIYVCGRSFRSNYRFFYNGGSVKIAAADTNKTYYAHFIAKLNKYGAVLWHTTVSDHPNQVVYDNTGKIIVIGDVEDDSSFYYIKNDTALTYTMPPGGWVGHRYQYIYRVDTLDGKLLRTSIIDERAINSYYEGEVLCDKEGSIFIANQYEDGIIFYAPGRTDSIVLNNPRGLFTGLSLYLVKIDSSGKPAWVLHDRHNLSDGTGSFPTSMSMSPNGTIYITTYPGFAPEPGDSLIFYNSDASATTLSNIYNGNIYAISKDGFIKWYANGGMSNYMGAVATSDTTIHAIGYNMFRYPIPNNMDTFFNAKRSGYKIVPNRTPNITTVAYDSSGVVKNVMRMGSSNGPNLYQIMDGIALNNASVLCYGDYELYSGTDSTVYFSDTIRMNNGYDGYMIKYTPGICDTVNPPPFPPGFFVNEPLADTLLCEGDTFYVQFTVRNSFNTGNKFYAVLSDAVGMYSSFVNVIGSVTAQTSDSIRCIVPLGTQPGTGYKIKIVASTPMMETLPTVKNLTIDAKIPVSIRIAVIPPTLNIPAGTTLMFLATAGNGGTKPYYQWKINGIDVPGAHTDTFITNTLMDNDSVTVIVHNSAHCAEPDTAVSNLFVIKITNGINDLQGGNVIKCYPNPSAGVFNIKGYNISQDHISADVSDVTGSSVYRQEIDVVDGKISENIKLPEKIPNGVYFLRLYNDQYTSVRKIIVQK